jgi:site-specific DNA-methyltransferase (adenine-specific)
MAMFPPSMPHTFITWLTNPGDVVYDPFAGRGTTPLEACLTGRVGLGSDANPLAWLLTASKVDIPTLRQVERRLADLRSRAGEADIDSVPPDIRMLFADSTLAQLIWLRSVLDTRRRTDRFVMSVLAGGLHGNANRNGTTRGLTVAMPNTFAMSPGYVRRYIKEQGLVAPEVDVLGFLERRIRNYDLEPANYRRGDAWLGDARSSQWPTGVERAKLIFTSPPYLEVIQYGKYNWIRLWLIEEEPKQVDRDSFTSSSVDRYVEFMSSVIRQLELKLRPDGYLVLTLGDVRRGDRNINLAEVVRDRCLGGTRLKVVGIVVDAVPEKHKVSRIWKSKPGRATKVDRLLVLSGPEARDMPPLAMPDWEKAS